VWLLLRVIYHLHVVVWEVTALAIAKCADPPAILPFLFNCNQVAYVEAKVFLFLSSERVSRYGKLFLKWLLHELIVLVCLPNEVISHSTRIIVRAGQGMVSVVVHHETL
jgi:hypothetical protein